jgi:hypothetical protein
MTIKKGLDISLVTILITVASLCGGAVWVAHQELSRIDARLASMERRIQANETAVRTLARLQPNATVRDLVNDQLSVRAAAWLKRQGIEAPAVADRSMPAERK